MIISVSPITIALPGIRGRAYLNETVKHGFCTAVLALDLEPDFLEVAHFTEVVDPFQVKRLLFV